jgi:HD superfamily phosphohydrolase
MYSWSLFRFLYDIVSNQRNGVDVDKFDYLSRDSHHLNLRLSFDFKRTLQAFKVSDDGMPEVNIAQYPSNHAIFNLFPQVMNGEVCYERSHYQHLHELFHSRELMHRQVYTDTRVHAYNLMVADALVEAEPVRQLNALRRTNQEMGPS